MKRLTLVLLMGWFGACEAMPGDDAAGDQRAPSHDAGELAEDGPGAETGDDLGDLGSSPGVDADDDVSPDAAEPEPPAPDPSAADEAPSPDAPDAPDAVLPDDEGPTAEEPAPPGDTSVPASLTAILDDIPGFAAGTLGGREGTLYTVTGLHDAGPGSLREALESTEPLWIVFAPGLHGILDMQGALRVRSFKTVDARGHDITLRATGAWNGGLRIGVANEPGVEHVVLLNLKFDGQWPNYTEDAEGDDGINIRNGSHHVWIHQCSFTNWVDGAIDAKFDEGFPLPHHITISNSLFTKTHQPLAVAIDQLTFARNHCVDVTKRCVQLNSGARGHMVNNVIEDWRAVSIVAPRDGAQLLVDHNLFKPGPDCDAVGNPLREDTDEYGRWQNEKNHWRLSWGWVAFKEATSVDTSVFTAARAAYAPAQCGPFDLACWDALFEDVVAGAGARP